MSDALRIIRIRYAGTTVASAFTTVDHATEDREALANVMPKGYTLTTDAPQPLGFLIMWLREIKREEEAS